jgi:thioredoxin reductase
MNLTLPLSFLTMSLATNLTTTLFDALIIGAGPAGLSVATGLARQLHTAVVFDSGVYRNARATHMHNVLGWDHVNPTELRAKGKADLLARYTTVQFQNETVESVRRLKTERSLFEAVDTKGNKWYGRKVVLATGVKDVMLDIQGFEEMWGRNMCVSFTLLSKLL